jgi:polysaccharide export outer membrane protein
MRILRTLFLFGLPLIIISCGTQQRLPYYLDNTTDTTKINKEVKVPELKIQKGDLLSIQVYSESTRPEVSDVLYNLPGMQTNSGQSSGGTGFLVDGNGNIEYPRVGVLHVEGLTKQEIAGKIKAGINAKDTVLLNPSVIIRLLNYKITVLGQVAKEGSIPVPGEKINVLEAVGLAGGITDYGKKNTVKIVRETDGKREIGIIDLSSKDLFDSPYYNLVQNDVLIVEPTKQKAKQADQSVVAQRVSFALSVITAAAFIYNVFR